MSLNRTFSPQELQILIALQENPNATLEEIAKATNFSTSLVFKILKKLTDTDTYEKQAFNVIAHPNLFALGLEIIDVIVKCKNLTQIQLMRQLSILHPYSIYWAKCFGEINGIFLQFRIPVGTRYNITELFSQLKDQNYIEYFQIFEFGIKNVIFTTVRLDSWNLEQLSWNFNWENWFNKQSEISQDENSTKNENKISPQISSRKSGYVKKWLKQRDVAILNELVVGARRKNKEIMDTLQKKSKINFSPQSFSRRFMKIKEECVDLFRVFIDPNAFQLITPVLILGKGNKIKINEFTKRMKLDPIPFNSVVKTRNSQFFFYLQVPSIYLTYILNILQEIMNELQFFYIDVGTVRTWGFWHETYDNDKHNWIQTRDFMVDDVLKGISKFAQKK